LYRQLVSPFVRKCGAQKEPDWSLLPFQSGIRIRVLKNRKDDPHHPGLVILRHLHVLLLLLPLYDLLLDEEGGDGVVDDLL
jgi:hypothetical protein